MFFGMTNSPAIFQVIINEILRDLTNKGKVTAFVDNVLVETETKEGYNEIVEEILRRLEENDLYVKLEKCVVSEPTPEPELSQLLFYQQLTERTRQSSHWILYIIYI